MDHIGELYRLFPSLGVLIGAKAIRLFSGDLDHGLSYYGAIGFLTIELSLANKSSPFSPLLEMKL